MSPTEVGLPLLASLNQFSQLYLLRATWGVLAGSHAVYKYALTCVLTGFPVLTVPLPGLCCGSPAPGTSAQYIPRRLANFWFSEEESSPLPSLPCPGRILQQLDFHLSPFTFSLPSSVLPSFPIHL